MGEVGTRISEVSESSSRDVINVTSSISLWSRDIFLRSRGLSNWSRVVSLWSRVVSFWSRVVSVLSRDLEGDFFSSAFN